MDRRKYKTALCVVAALVISAALPFSVSASSGYTEAGIPVRLEVTDGAPVSDEDFRFRLVPLDGAPMPEDGQEYCDAVRKGAGDAYFPALGFGTVGVYRYEISQIAGTIPGIKYDESVYEATVTVFNSDVRGELIAAVSVISGGMKTDCARFMDRYTVLAGPDDPYEPDHPVQPEDPEGPEDPPEPDVPDDPGDSDGPERPDDPDRPEGPDSPGSPGRPNDPERAGDPEEPQRETLPPKSSEDPAKPDIDRREITGGTPVSGLIQTGRILWPVYLLAGAGIFMIIAGAALPKRSGKKKDE